MELIDRYIYAVTRGLPQKQQGDISKELRSHIEDMVAERVEEHRATEEDIKAVLKELGEPSKLAVKYSGRPRYIIGPEMYDSYIMSLKVILSLVAFGMIIAMIVSYSVSPPQNLWDILGSLIGSLLGKVPHVVFQVFAWLTVIFALVDRFVTDKSDWDWKKGDWDPAQLPEIPPKGTTINRIGPVIAIAVIAVTFVLFNFAAGWFGLFLPDSGDVPIRLFNVDVLQEYLPLIYIYFAISVVRQVLKLIIGRNILKLLLINACLGIVAFFLGLIVLSNMNIWNLHFVDQIVGVFPHALPPNFDSAQSMIVGPRIVLGLFILLFAVGLAVTGSRVYRHVKMQRPK